MVECLLRSAAAGGLEFGGAFWLRGKNEDFSLAVHCFIHKITNTHWAWFARSVVLRFYTRSVQASGFEFIVDSRSVGETLVFLVRHQQLNFWTCVVVCLYLLVEFRDFYSLYRLCVLHTLTLQQVISVVEEICTNRTNIKYYWINSTTQLYIRSQHSIPLLISDYSLDSTCVINTISPSHSSFCLFKSLKSVKISSATVTRYENVHQVFGSRKDTNSCFHSTATYSPTINNEWVLCSISTFDWKSKPFI